MVHTKVLVDTYSVGGDGNVRVLGRYNHVSSTDVDIARTVEFDISRAAVANVQYINGFDVASEQKFDPQQNYQPYHTLIANDTHDVHTRKYGLNRMIESLTYKPVGCQNSYECMPKEQAVILPYLCEDQVEKNTNYLHTSAQQAAVLDDPGIDNWAPRYDPRFMGGYVISTWTNPQVLLNAETMAKNSFIPEELVTITEADADGLLPCVYDKTADTITIPAFTLHVDQQVFGYVGAHANKFVFHVPVNTLPNNANAFDVFGRNVHRSGATDHVTPVVTHKELFPVRLDNVYQGQQPNLNGQPALNANAAANNADGQVNYGANGVKLWCDQSTANENS